MTEKLLARLCAPDAPAALAPAGAGLYKTLVADDGVHGPVEPGRATPAAWERGLAGLAGLDWSLDMLRRNPGLWRITPPAGYLEFGASAALILERWFDPRAGALVSLASEHEAFVAPYAEDELGQAKVWLSALSELIWLTSAAPFDRRLLVWRDGRLAALDPALPFHRPGHAIGFKLIPGRSS